MVEACGIADVRRVVMVSAMGTDDPPQDESGFSTYLRAKADADAAVRAGDLDWTIIRPGRLTDAAGAGTVAIDRHVTPGEVPREDVAAVLAAVLTRPETAEVVAEVVGGATPIEDAVAAL